MTAGSHKANKRSIKGKFSAVFEKSHPDPEALEELLQYARLSDRAQPDEQAKELQQRMRMEDNALMGVYRNPVELRTQGGIWRDSGP